MDSTQAAAKCLRVVRVQLYAPSPPPSWKAVSFIYARSVNMIASLGPKVVDSDRPTLLTRFNCRVSGRPVRTDPVERLAGS